jgi:hypothetical protein
MGELASLSEARRQRLERRRLLAEQAPQHPALRWNGGAGPLAHRRARDGATACGIPGPLTLADLDDAYCPICYPYWAAVGR